MPILCRKPKAGDSSGSFTVHCPEEVLRAIPKDGGFEIEAHRGSSVRALLRKGWRLSGETTKSRPSKIMTAKVSVIKSTSQSLLDSSVRSIERALKTGKHDSDLESLLAAEEGGKTRKSVVVAIMKRMEQR